MTLCQKTPRTYKVFDLSVGNDCYRYSSITTRDRDFELFPMSSVHLKNYSVYLFRKDLRSLQVVIGPISIELSIKSHPIFSLSIKETSDHLGWERILWLVKNDIKVNCQRFLKKIC